jgi:hypothetical protein
VSEGKVDKNNHLIFVNACCGIKVAIECNNTVMRSKKWEVQLQSEVSGIPETWI